MTTGFYWSERCFWHVGAGYALTAPLGDVVEPLASGLPDTPESKRRLKSLMDLSGLSSHLVQATPPPATEAQMRAIHPAPYLEAFKSLSNARGGELGPRAPFGRGGYEIAAQSAGLVAAAVQDVLSGTVQNAYALSRPPGHHCLPETPNGFCLLANIAIAVEDAISRKQASRIAVLDWDVHHGNGTEAIFYDRAEVLTLSIHQERNYPLDTGGVTDQGEGAGTGANINVPLPPGAGDATYLEVMDRIILPALRRFEPDLIIVACGFDAAAFDPLGRMLVSAAGFGQLTDRMLQAAADLCSGRLVLAHEGGYSEVYVPFCGHASIAALAGAPVTVEDPLDKAVAGRQPGPAMQSWLSGQVAEQAAFHLG